MNKDLMDIVRACDVVHFSTNGENGYPETRHLSNAMNINGAGDCLYFMTGRNTPKYAQLARDARCGLYYFDTATRHALRIFGEIEFVTDASVRHEQWRDEYQKFGYLGPDDLNFVLMRFMPESYKYYNGSELKSGKI